jgi:hypothetical protein
VYKYLLDEFPDVTAALFNGTKELHAASKYHYPLIDLRQIAPELHERLESVFGDRLIKTRLFITPPESKSGIHIDGIPGSDSATKWAVNFPVSGCDYTFMNWYTVREKPQSLSERYGNSVAATYEPSDVIATIASAIIDRPTLVCVSIPHSVSNPNQTPRVVLSCRFFRCTKTTFEDEVKRSEERGA